jgi:hypothetical protein
MISGHSRKRLRLKLERWDEKPVYLHYDGKPLECFYRSALAKALNREIITIRMMESRGQLRHPKLRDYRGRWCYTRSQIEDLIRLAKEEGVIDPRHRRTFSDRFIKEANAILRRKPI